MIRYEILTSFDTKDSKLRGHLKWWSNKTFKEQRMLTKSVKFFNDNLIYAIFAFDDEGEIVGAAGLIPCLNRHKEKMYFENKLVVELASNYVDPNYRDHHIATEFVIKRLSFCKENNLFPVSVTGNSQIKTIFSHVALQMKDFPQYHHIYKEVRVCDCTEDEKPSCKVCPLKEKAIWIFKDFI